MCGWSRGDERRGPRATPTGANTELQGPAGPHCRHCPHRTRHTGSDSQTSEHRGQSAVSGSDTAGCSLQDRATSTLVHAAGARSTALRETKAKALPGTPVPVPRRSRLACRHLLSSVHSHRAGVQSEPAWLFFKFLLPTAFLTNSRFGARRAGAAGETTACETSTPLPRAILPRSVLARLGARHPSRVQVVAARGGGARRPRLRGAPPRLLQQVPAARPAGAES